MLVKRPEKFPRLSTELPKKDRQGKPSYSNYPDKVSEFNKSKNNQIKKMNSSSSKCVKTSAVTTSTPNSINKVPPESTSPKLKKQSTNVDLNSKLDSASIDKMDKSVSPKRLQVVDCFDFHKINARY